MAACRTESLIVVLVYQCLNCEKEYSDEAAAKDCCRFTRKYYKCLGCGLRFGAVGRQRNDKAIAHALEYKAKGFCGEVETE